MRIKITLAKSSRIQLPTESELLVAKTFVDAQRTKNEDNEEGDGDDSEVEDWLLWVFYGICIVTEKLSLRFSSCFV